MKILLITILILAAANMVKAFVPGSDITKELQNAADKGGKIIIPDGIYELSSPVSVHSDTAIEGSGNTIIRLSSAFHAFELIAKDNSSYIERTVIARLHITTPRPAAAAAVYCKNVSGLTVSHITTQNMAGVRLEAIEAKRNHLNRNILIKDCIFSGGKANIQGIEIDWTDGFKIENCTVSDFIHGIQWWGGDSDVRRGGYHENYGFLQNGIIKNCTVRSIEGGGIWGSFGRNIHVIGCTVSECGDVGIDFEGCDNSSAESCTASDCTNGNYATFQYCTGKILFKSCTSIFTRSFDGVVGTCHYFNGNETQMTGIQDITFDGCVFKSTAASWIKPWHALSQFTMRNCQCFNCTLDTAMPHLNYLKVEDNTFEFDSSASKDRIAVFAAISSELQTDTPKIIISGNSVSAKNGACGIFLLNNSDIPVSAVYYENTIKGFEQSVRAESTEAAMSISGLPSSAKIQGQVELREHLH